MANVPSSISRFEQFGEIDIELDAGGVDLDQTVMDDNDDDDDDDDPDDGDDAAGAGAGAGAGKRKKRKFKRGKKKIFSTAQGGRCEGPSPGSLI